MATVGRANGASVSNTARLSYYSTEVFASRFFTYSTSLNNRLETIGTLTQVSGANSTTCPAGRVLRENGRKLYPDANPGITTYMVGVYDAQTMLSGFIDPNGKAFQIYNTDKPNFLADGVDSPSGLTDRGPSIYTRGNVLGGGNLDISGNGLIHGDLTVFGDVDISGNELVRGNLGVQDNVDISGTLVVTGTTTHRNHVTLATGDLIVSTGVFKLNESNGTGSYNAGNAIVGRAGFGGNGSITITTSSCLTSSYVFLTLVAGGTAVLRVSATNAGSFTVTSSAGATSDTFNWLIINPA